MTTVAEMLIDALFKPLRINNRIQLRNRFVMAPMTRNRCPQGVPGRDVADYYARRAANEVALIITEGVAVDHPAAVGDAGLSEFAVPNLHGEAALAGWRQVVEATHAAGGIIFPQLWHQGVMRVDGTGDFPDARSMRPSGLWGRQGARTSSAVAYVEKMLPPTRAMTDSEIADVIAAFARSAANAKALGFDGIALHGGHGYLFDAFFWEVTNRRPAPYGGGLSERCRFAADVVRAIRAEVGVHLPIMFRFSQWKQQDFDARIAQDPAELEQWLTCLVDAGVDMFDASTRMFDSPEFEGSTLTLAGWTRLITGKVTMAVGGVGTGRDFFTRVAGTSGFAANNIDRVATAMIEGQFDLIGVGRALLADPHFIQKVRDGADFLPYTQEARDVLY